VYQYERKWLYQRRTGNQRLKLACLKIALNVRLMLIKVVRTYRRGLSFIGYVS